MQKHSSATSRTARSVNSSPTEGPRTASRHAELAFFAFGMHGGFGGFGGGGVRRLVKSDAAAPPPMNRIPRPPLVSRLAAAERGRAKGVTHRAVYINKKCKRQDEVGTEKEEEEGSREKKPQAAAGRI